MNRFVLPLCLLCLIPLPVSAQDAGTPQGLRSLEMSDDTINTLYKLKSGESAEKNDTAEPDAMDSDQPAGSKPPSEKPTPSPKAGSTNTEPTPNSTAPDPNLQSHTLTITPDGAANPTPNTSAKTDSKDEKSTPKEDQKQKPSDPDTSKIDEKVFTPAAKLKPWDKRNTLYGLGQNTEKIRAALIVFESEPEYANPQTLIDVAALYAQVGDYKSAARYYYAANLRRAFDTIRFPSSTIPALDGGTWGESVGAWVTNSSARMQNTLNDVRAWDERIPYRYHPGYTVPEASINTHVPDESEWADILNTTRTDFFKSVGEMSQALGRMGR